ncbi:MAG: hypothetical protein ACK4NY_22485 [Spirosomataceae bacterium]
MNKYLNGLLHELIAKATVLKSKIPGAFELNVYFEALSTKANIEIDDVINKALFYITDSRLNHDSTVKQKVKYIKQLNQKLSILETVVVAALMRNHDDDIYVNQLVREICKEIKYPIDRPVVTCLSQDSYHIYPQYNLLCVPLLEADFLLHIPILYHELAHPIISNENPKVKLFIGQLGQFNSMVIDHFAKEVKREEMNDHRQDFIDSIYLWRDSWTENWSTEFFCDLFALYTLGPAFAWSYLHLIVKVSSNVFNYDIDSHPPDDARIKVLIHGLNLIGFKDDAKKILKKWNDFIVAMEYDKKKKGRYDSAVPDFFLEDIAVRALQGTKNIGCKIVTPTDNDGIMKKMLNDAWVVFWKDMSSFQEWEEQEVKKLRNTFNS